MTDITKQTTNQAFQKIGGAQTIEPADYDNMLDAIDKSLGGVGNVAADFTLATAGVAVSNITGRKSGVQYVRLTLTNVSVAATNAHKYGGTEILNWPNVNILVVAARMNLVGTKDGVQIQAADQPTVAIGSAVASNTVLSAAMEDTVGNFVTLAATAAAAAQLNKTPATGRAIAAGTTNKLFLNIGATGNTGGGDGSVSFSGTVDVYYINTGTFG